jgi:hypothetical protein
LPYAYVTVEGPVVFGEITLRGAPAARGVRNLGEEMGRGYVADLTRHSARGGASRQGIDVAGAGVCRTRTAHRTVVP